MEHGELEQLRIAIDTARTGEPTLLGQELARRWPALLARIRWMMGPAARRHAETGDFAQDMLVDVLKALPGFELRDVQSFWSWLLTIAQRRMVQAVRRRREQLFARFTTSLLAADDRIADPRDQLVQEEDLQRMAMALENLAEDRRRVIELRDLEGQSYRQIAATLDRTENAVQLLHARALAELARQLGS